MTISRNSEGFDSVHILPGRLLALSPSDCDTTGTHSVRTSHRATAFKTDDHRSRASIMPLQRSNTDIAGFGQPVNTVRSFRDSGGLVTQGYISDLTIRHGATSRDSFYEVRFIGFREGRTRRMVIPLGWLRTADGRTFDHLRPTDPASLASDGIKAMLMGKSVKAFMNGPIAPLEHPPPKTAGSNERNPYKQIQYVILNVPRDDRLSKTNEIGSDQRTPGLGGFRRSNTV